MKVDPEMTQARKVLSEMVMEADDWVEAEILARAASKLGGLTEEVASRVCSFGPRLALRHCAKDLSPDDLLRAIKEEPLEALQEASDLIPDVLLLELAQRFPKEALRCVPLARFDRETLERLVKAAFQ